MADPLFVKVIYKDRETVIEAKNLNDIQDAILKTFADLTDHIGDTENPHGVTPAQIGAATTQALQQVAGDLENLTADDIGAVSYLVAQTLTTEQQNRVLQSLGFTAAQITNIRTWANITLTKVGTI